MFSPTSFDYEGFGHTLCYAAKTGQTMVISTLAMRNPVVFAQYAGLAIQEALEAGKGETIQHIMDLTPRQGLGSGSALEILISLGPLEKVYAVLKDLDFVSHGSEVFRGAVLRKDPALIREITSRTIIPRKTLDWAFLEATRISLDIMTHFVRLGANPRSQEDEALVTAVRLNDRAQVIYLLNLGLDPEAQGGLPILLAEDEDMAKLLCSRRKETPRPKA